MIIHELHLGITRNCSLYCEHCLRGEKECVNMSFETLDNLFKDVTQINVLLLTGGEPLIAIRQLEYLSTILKEKRIKVGEIRLITNGTIFSSRVLKVLESFKELADLRFMMSDDIFHLLELERLDLMGKRNQNARIYQETLGLRMYGTEEDSIFTQLLDYKGRTKTLSKERLSEINSMIKCAYVTRKDIESLDKEGDRLYFIDDYLFGQLTINVHGNIVGYGLEFAEEDIEERETNLNINQLGLRESVNRYIDLQEKKIEMREAKFLKKIMNR